MSNFHHHDADISNGLLSLIFGLASTAFAGWLLDIAVHTLASLVPAVIVAVCVFFLNRFLKKRYPDENRQSKP